MIKKLFVLLTIISTTAFGQHNEGYSIDSTVKINIGHNFRSANTLGQQIVRGELGRATIVIVIQENKGRGAINIRSEQELISHYKGFEDGFIYEQKGKILKNEIVDMKGIKCSKFSIRTGLNIPTNQHCLLFFVIENDI